MDKFVTQRSAIREQHRQDRETNMESETNTENKLSVELSTCKEVILMVGYPGSGKSTLAKSISEQSYQVMSLDEHKTIPKLLKIANQAIQTNSVIFDATNMTVNKRAIYINFANEHTVPIRCVWIDMCANKAIDRVATRFEEGGKKVPKIAIYKLRKTFEEPTEEEGFKLIHIKA